MRRIFHHGNLVGNRGYQHHILLHYLFLSDPLSYREIILCDKFHLIFPVVSFILLPQPSQPRAHMNGVVTVGSAKRQLSDMMHKRIALKEC